MRSVTFAIQLAVPGRVHLYLISARRMPGAPRGFVQEHGAQRPRNVLGAGFDHAAGAELQDCLARRRGRTPRRRLSCSNGSANAAPKAVVPGVAAADHCRRRGVRVHAAQLRPAAGDELGGPDHRGLARPGRPARRSRPAGGSWNRLSGNGGSDVLARRPGRPAGRPAGRARKPWSSSGRHGRPTRGFEGRGPAPRGRPDQRTVDGGAPPGRLPVAGHQVRRREAGCVRSGPGPSRARKQAAATAFMTGMRRSEVSALPAGPTSRRRGRRRRDAGHRPPEQDEPGGRDEGRAVREGGRRPRPPDAAGVRRPRRPAGARQLPATGSFGSEPARCCDRGRRSSWPGMRRSEAGALRWANDAPARRRGLLLAHTREPQGSRR